MIPSRDPSDPSGCRRTGLASGLRSVAAGHVVKRVAYPVADRLLESYGALRCRNYDIRKSIALVATGRGGSTWLAELLLGLPNRVLIWEPLHLGNNPAIAEYGFGWNPYVPTDGEAPALETYLQRLLTGRALSTRTLTSLNFEAAALINPAGFVVKFVQAHALMPWFVRRFPVPVIGLVRHPCAVVASQLNHGQSWRTLTKEKLSVSDQMLEDFPHIQRVFDRLSTTPEALAFEWATKTYFLLRTERRLLLTYETMLAEPQRVARQIFGYLGHEVPPDVIARIRAPSATTHRDAVYRGWEDRLGGWKENISVEDQAGILRIAHEVGVDLYDDGVNPREDLLPTDAAPSPTV